MSIEQKSTGTLLGEFITACLKLKYMGDKSLIAKRVIDLGHALNNRSITVYSNETKFSLIEKEYKLLAGILDELWWAVEDTIVLRKADPNDMETIKKAGYAALKAFELNAKRCQIIQQIDRILGEEEFTFLEKSY